MGEGTALRRRRNRQSRAIFADMAARGQASIHADALHVFNTTQWPRTDLVTLPKDMKLAGEQVADAEGRPVPTQRVPRRADRRSWLRTCPRFAQAFSLAARPGESRWQLPGACFNWYSVQRFVISESGLGPHLGAAADRVVHPTCWSRRSR